MRLSKTYAEFLRIDGEVVIITPQEAGFASDATHVEFIDFSKAAQIARAAGLTLINQYSFPFPRIAGKVFRHNEFVTVASKVMGP